MHPQIVCDGAAHLEQELQTVHDKKGEGIMLRDPDSYYEYKRSWSLLKAKKFFDAEARVIGLTPGKDSLQLKSLETGVEFKCKYVGNMKIGTIITYKYWGLMESGRPRFPQFLRIKEME